MAAAMRRDVDGASRSMPDPSVLTTAAVQRESSGIQREIVALRELFESKFDGYDKAIELLQANADKTPSIAVVEQLVLSLRALHDEKFKGVSTQFVERDVRTEQTFSQSQIALNVALSTAKEAVEKQNASSAQAIAKSEAATAKQIEQIIATFGETVKGITDKIDDIKERGTSVENRVIAMESRGTGRHDVWGWVAGGIGLAIGVASVIVALMR